MNTKEVALCSIFTAIAIALERVRIPAVFAPIQFYFWEIPIVIAALLFGLKFGFSVAALSAFGQALIFPRALGFLFPIWNLIEMSAALVGVYLAQRLITWRISRTSQEKAFKKIKPVVYFTASVMAVRFAVTPFVNFFMYKYMMPIVVGQSFSDAYIIALTPALLVFDAILVFYSVPTSYIIAKMLNKNLSIGNRIF
jgi:hypothetical protein